MRIRLIAASVCAAALATAPALLGAQSTSTMTNAKRVASNAAAATNAHTAAMEGGAASSEKKPAAAKPATPAASPEKNAAPAPATTKPAATKPAAPSTTPAPAPAPSAEEKKAAPAQTARAPKSEVVIVREEFTYGSEGRRDPFLSLMKTGELRPMISDLRLVTVVYDPVGRSVAIMRDVTTKEQYRVKVGQTLGRMRVTQIRPREVVFTLEEYGFSRQEVLALNDSTRARSQ
jgi:hypothetical protein